MDERSRRDYRARVETLSRRKNKSEARVAEEALRLAERADGVRGVTSATGSMKIPSARGVAAERRRGVHSRKRPFHACALRGERTVDKKRPHGSAGAAAGLGGREGTFGPRAAPRRAAAPSAAALSERRRPAEGKTVCVLSVLLTGEKAANVALRRLEEFRAASRGCGENLLFGLLCDLPESGETLSHADRALLDHAAAKTDALNAHCGGGFYLFTRDRLYSRDSGKFAPWERKRGAVLELWPSARRGEHGSLCPCRRRGEAAIHALYPHASTPTRVSSRRAPENSSARRSTRSTARRSIPNAGSFFAATACCIRASPCRSRARTRNDFTRLFAPTGGGDPYGSDAGEVYMDAFQSGGFAPGRALTMWGRISRVSASASLKGAY